VSRGSFSVALATYNGQRFLPLQLASLAAQTVLPTELVVCDDSSTDGTVRALEEFRADAPFPMKIHTNSEQLGFAETFFRCAARCSGDWIAFCDQDDLWLEQKLERCERELERPGVLLVVHSSRLADDRRASCIRTSGTTTWRDRWPVNPGKRFAACPWHSMRNCCVSRILGAAHVRTMRPVE
jgi:glycosyltransferase involved in cell wall biosynthesis